MSLWELVMNWLRPSPCIVVRELVVRSEEKISALDMRRKMTISNIVHIAKSDTSRISQS